MKINWKLRLQNKATLLAIISSVVVLVMSVTTALGVEMPLTEEQLMAAATAVLTILTALGVVVDPTTNGVSDSNRALGYDVPAANTTDDAVRAAQNEE